MAKPLFAKAKQSHANTKVTGSSRRMSLRLDEERRALQKLEIFDIFGSFNLKPINWGFFRLVKGSVFGMRTLLRVSPLFFLSYLGFLILFSITLFLELILKSYLLEGRLQL